MVWRCSPTCWSALQTERFSFFWLRKLLNDYDVLWLFGFGPDEWYFVGCGFFKYVFAHVCSSFVCFLSERLDSHELFSSKQHGGCGDKSCQALGVVRMVFKWASELYSIWLVYWAWPKELLGAWGRRSFWRGNVAASPCIWITSSSCLAELRYLRWRNWDGLNLEVQGWRIYSHKVLLDQQTIYGDIDLQFYIGQLVDEKSVRKTKARTFESVLFESYKSTKDWKGSLHFKCWFSRWRVEKLAFQTFPFGSIWILS